VSATASPTRRRRTGEELELRTVKLHGHTVGYRACGEGPLVVLIHGITSSSEAWREVMPLLAENFTVVAPDLFGHGRSAKPRGDYSLGAYASGIRDLLGVLGYEQGTAVGHSLGGGVALQFAYQFPQHTERLALISSGGLGREVHPLLRAAALPGSDYVLPLLTPDWVVRAGSAVGSFLDRIGIQTGADIAEFARGFASLSDADARQAFLHTLRAVLDQGGQRASAIDRLYLAEEMPTLFIWGTDDPIIPIAHGRAAHEAVPNSELVEIPGAGHWPQLEDPIAVGRALRDFIEATDPYYFDFDRIREHLRRGPG
jgi:pimeloyl-ACP methyl ester carboxylesterase